MGCPRLSEVKKVIQDSLHPAPGRLEDMVRLLLERSGKMLRPRLLLACAALAGEDGVRQSKALVEAAAAVEMIHTASLVHDDIIDEADRRRGGETMHLRWGPRRAVMAGDLLLAHAFDLLSRPGRNKNVLILLARAVSLLCLGEITQMNMSCCWEITERQYYQVNHLKTAQLIAACCEAGGWLKGAPEGRRRLLRLFGLKLGQTFQMVDDILDYTGYPGQMGKPAGRDLEQGWVTLPLIHLLKTQNHFLRLLRSLPPDSAPPRELQEALREEANRGGSLHYALAAARQKQAEAVRLLHQFAPSAERRQLTEITAALTAGFTEETSRLRG